MGDQTEFYKVSYLWRGCDHLMGFKEFVDIRRIVKPTWIEISNRESVFQRKSIGSFGDGIEFQSNSFDDLYIFRNILVLSEEDIKNTSVSMDKRIILTAYFFDPGYCILRYITGTVFSDDLYDTDSNSSICFSSSKFMDKCLNLTSRNVRSKGPVILDDRETTVCALPFFSWPPVAKEWITRDRNRCWPTEKTMDKVIFDGCHCVPVGNSASTTKHLG